jgi:hypothetical protein
MKTPESEGYKRVGGLPEGYHYEIIVDVEGKQKKQLFYKGMKVLAFHQTNRSARRSKPTRFGGNNKGWNMTVTPVARYKRTVQMIGKKRIEHYVLVK